MRTQKHTHISAALPEHVMRPLLEAALQSKRMTPWDKMCDTDFVGCRDERTGELRVSCVLGAAGEVFGMVSYRGVEGLGLVHAFLTQEGELRREQILNGKCVPTKNR